MLQVEEFSLKACSILMRTSHDTLWGRYYIGWMLISFLANGGPSLAYVTSYAAFCVAVGAYEAVRVISWCYFLEANIYLCVGLGYGWVTGFVWYVIVGM